MGARDSILYDVAKAGVAALIVWKINQHFHAQQAAQANNMRIKMSGVHMEHDGTINMDLQILNPNSAPFTFRSILGDLFVNNNKIAELKMFGEHTVRANDQATIAVMAKVQPGIIKSLADKLKGRQLIMSFAGTVNVNDKAIPLTMRYTI